MENKIMGNWQEYNKSAVAIAKDLEAINTQVIEKVTSAQMALANTTFEVGTKFVTSLSEVKGYQDLLAEQSRMISEYNEKLIESARNAADIMSEAREAYQAWLEKSMQVLTANADFTLPGFAPVAKKADKKAA